MSSKPGQDAIDRLNAWRDGAPNASAPAAAPPAAARGADDDALRRRLEAIEGELKRAFDPDRATQFVFAKLPGLIEAESAAEAAASAPRRRAAWPALRIAAMLAIVAGLAFVLVQNRRGDDGVEFRRVSAVAAYQRAVEGGMKPDWTCTPEELPGEIARRFDGASLALASLPADVTILGWTGPYATNQQVMDADELVLMARAGEEPVVLILADRRKADRPIASPEGATLHRARRGEFDLIEVSRLDLPVLIPHVRTEP